jgi:hypothetical protein
VATLERTPRNATHWSRKSMAEKSRRHRYDRDRAPPPAFDRRREVSIALKLLPSRRRSLPENIRLWHPSVSRGGEERCSRLGVGGSGK